MKDYIKASAFVVGINSYNEASKLEKAVNDANSIADKLENLKFYVKRNLDIDINSFDSNFDNFLTNLDKDKYDVALFYFAGHGIEMDGKNYLLVTNSPIGNRKVLERYSIDLQEVIGKVHDKGCNVNVFIIDACRNNPFGNSRAIGNLSLSPIFAPKGTIVAYSTSPGETAKDTGLGDNSIYTGALLKHIDTPQIPIEQFFKEVRTTVSAMSNMTQTSWEHTSLIGNFSFNSGQLIQSLNTPYSNIAISDKDYISEGIMIELILGFKSHNWGKQCNALSKFKDEPIKSFSKDDLFVIGRNILQSANGGEYKANSFLENPNELLKYTQDKSNHLLNGVLYEMYFDSSGGFRGKNLKTNLLDKIISYNTSPQLKSSFVFIDKVLSPFRENLIFIPSVDSSETNLNIVVVIEDEKIEVTSIKYESTELIERFYSYSSFEGYCYFANNIKEFEEKICRDLNIPLSLSKFIYSEESNKFGSKCVLLKQTDIFTPWS